MLLQAPQVKPGEMTPDQQFQIAMEAMRGGGIGFSSAILAMLVPFAVCLLIGVAVWLWYRQKQAQIEVQAEVHKQLLNKFSSGRELTEFLESKGGQRFFDAMSSQRRAGPDHVLRMMRTGIVLTTVGLGLLVWAITVGQKDQFFFAAVILPLGVGFLISAAVSHRFVERGEEKTPITSAS
jgi:nitrogen fixation-related uncharacterized protein